jgi:hypothetical protein
MYSPDEICALLGYYAALSGSSLPAFRDNLSIPPSRVKKSKKKKRYGTTTQCCVISQKSAFLIYIAAEDCITRIHLISCRRHMLEKTGIKYGSTLATYRLKNYDLVERSILYNIFNGFGVHMKLAGLIKIYLNETHSEVKTSKPLSDSFHTENYLIRMKCHARAFQIYFRICHYESLSKA